jgi:hypothetical protein
MFGELNLPTFNVETIASGVLFRGKFEPKGDMLIYLNDNRYTVIRLDDAALYPVAEGVNIRGVRQPMMAITKETIQIVSVLDKADMAHLMLLSSKRPFVAYTSHYAVQGNLHVNTDARDDDIFDETKIFFAMSDATIYPIYSGRHQPVAKVAAVMINQQQILAYHPYQKN